MLAQARTRNQLAGMEVERAQKLVNTQAISREELDARTSGRAEGKRGGQGRRGGCASGPTESGVDGRARADFRARRSRRRSPPAMSSRRGRRHRPC